MEGIILLMNECENENENENEKIYKIKLYYYMRVDIKRLYKKDIYSSTKLKPLVANMLSLYGPTLLQFMVEL